MAQQKLHCRDHGGYFYRESQRGRKPVRCSEDNPCDAATNVPVEREPVRERHTQALKRAARVPERSTERRTAGNPSLDKGKAAKDSLEAEGWTVTGKAWTDGDGATWASITGARGEEMLHIVWKDGIAQDQVYNLWNLDVPSKNGRPNAHLPFDPDEVPDAELAQLLSGMKVTWWNKLAQKEESAICGKDKLKITHIWTGTGDENPGARIIDFVDPELGHFKAFRLDQLVKVG